MSPWQQDLALLVSAEVRFDTSKTWRQPLPQSSIDKDQTVRITFLGGLVGKSHPLRKRFSMKFKTEPTREDLKEQSLFEDCARPASKVPRFHRIVYNCG